MKLNEQLAVINPEEWILIRTNNTLFHGQKKDIPSIIIERNYKVLKTEICDYINNVEDEVFCELTDEEVDEVAENIWGAVADDNELSNVLNSTIELYAKHYIAEHFNK